VNQPLRIERDDEHDSVTIEGVRYSGAFFRAMAGARVPRGQRVVIKAGTGRVVVEVQEEAPAG
jgi:hypothetical protein